MAVFLRERKPQDLDELAKIAEQYLDAHASKNTTRRIEQHEQINREKKVESNTNLGNKTAQSVSKTSQCSDIKTGIRKEIAILGGMLQNQNHRELDYLVLIYLQSRVEERFVECTIKNRVNCV